jgi:sterol desaturase/sphingolipid hydroxylase (fatty acid hydroxylase superfamily)
VTPGLAALIGFVLVPLACIAIERLWPSIPSQRLLRPGLLSDTVWYVVEAYVARAVAPLFIAWALAPAVTLSGMTSEEFYSGFGPAGALPFWWQVPIVFVLADFLSYWQHRIFHKPAIWPIHAVHHSSRELDWLSSGRFHPLNEIGAQLVYVTPVLLLGFHSLTFLVLAPFTTWYVVFVHCNVGWTFGPFRYLVASPAFHRWHHTMEEEGRDRNYAGILPVWDLLFGTFYMPDRVPATFGTSDAVPHGFIGQLTHPVRPRASAPERVRPSPFRA